jgi:xanthine dehydrogenase accessory factor
LRNSIACSKRSISPSVFFQRRATYVQYSGEIFDFLIASKERGERTALVTITAIIGSSSRAVGTHLGVSEAGGWIGSLSGGCIEAAVAAEARRVMKSGAAEVLRLGAGSPLIDIRLPCGGGLDLLIAPEPGIDALYCARDQLKARIPTVLSIGRHGTVTASAFSEGISTGWAGETFNICHTPKMRLFILGQGEEVVAMARLATAFGAEPIVLTPDDAAHAALVTNGHLLQTPSPSPHLASDKYSAIIFLFHDHDWEAQLLPQALAQDAFFIGAMGSQQTQAMRQTMLRDGGVPAAQIARLTGPIGLIPATRDPDSLALSTLAQIVSVFVGQCHT